MYGCLDACTSVDVCGHKRMANMADIAIAQHPPIPYTHKTAKRPPDHPPTYPNPLHFRHIPVYDTTQDPCTGLFPEKQLLRVLPPKVYAKYQELQVT